MATRIRPGQGAAFTLIELLIVVAILAILAAVAVPNFMEAQARSKVSHARANLRVLELGLEAYVIEQKAYPSPMEQHNQIAWGSAEALSTPPFHSRAPSLLTTPVAYLSVLPTDPFRDAQPGLLWGAQQTFQNRPVYFNYSFFEEALPAGITPDSTFGHARALAGDWLLYSVGPDNDEFNRGDFPGEIVNRRVYIDYDPTNGTLSLGNVFRSQAKGDGLGVDEYFYQ